jgi:hypothetical protein
MLYRISFRIFVNNQPDVYQILNSVFALIIFACLTSSEIHNIL